MAEQSSIPDRVHSTLFRQLSASKFFLPVSFPTYNCKVWHTHTHNRFTAGLEYVRVHPGQQVPER